MEDDAHWRDHESLSLQPSSHALEPCIPWQSKAQDLWWGGEYGQRTDCVEILARLTLKYAPALSATLGSWCSNSRSRSAFQRMMTWGIRRTMRRTKVRRA